MPRLFRLLAPLLTASACACPMHRWYELLEAGQRPGDGHIVEAVGAADDEADWGPGDVWFGDPSKGDRIRISIVRVMPLTEAEAKERIRRPYAHLLTRGIQRPDASQLSTDEPPDLWRVR